MDDNDGFDPHYDCVIVGTSLVQSIVSSALSKQGKKVLHLDKNDYYGGNDHATFNLTQFLDICSKRLPSTTGISSTDSDSVTQVVTESIQSSISRLAAGGHAIDCPIDALAWRDVESIGGGNTTDRVTCVECSSNILSYNSTEDASHSSGITDVRRSAVGSPACFGYLMEHTNAPPSDPNIHPVFMGYRENHEPTLSRLLYRNREFNIDSNPKLLLSAGKMVDAIIESGVGHYLEFKSIDSVYYIAPSNTANSPVSMHRVPSSKSDIFNSKLFTALEKRSLMKLMQFAVDRGRAAEGLPVETLNETELAQGRALFRPQNKDTKSSISSDTLDTQPDQLFTEFLAQSKVSNKLAAFISHGLCLEPSVTATARSSLDGLYRHINASGRYGHTSFLMPIYGTSEFAQAFCRLSAVWGGIFVLRDTVQAILTTPADPAHLNPRSKGSDSDVTLPTECTPAGANDALNCNQRVVAVRLTSGRVIGCGHLITDQTVRTLSTADENKSTLVGTSNSEEPTRISSSKRGYRLVQRHSLITHSILPDKEAVRGVLVIPPHTDSLDNDYAVYAIQLDPTTLVAPTGVYVLYTMTYMVTEGESDIETRAAELMTNTISLLRRLSLSNERSLEEIMFASFLHPEICEIPAAATSGQYNNLLECDASHEHLLYIHEAVVQAEKIFYEVCPDGKFLMNAEEINAMQSVAEEDPENEGLNALLAAATTSNSGSTAENRTDVSTADVDFSIGQGIAEQQEESAVSSADSGEVDRSGDE